MPKKAEHICVGLGVSTLVESLKIQNLPPYKAGAEMVGVLVGSYLGSRMPDLLEPPVQPRHWGVAHSVTLGAVLSALTITVGPILQSEFRAMGDEYFEDEAYYMDHHNPVLATLCRLVGMMWYAIAGLTTAFLMAYLSHLGLDQLKSKSNLPLLGTPLPSTA